MIMSLAAMAHAVMLSPSGTGQVLLFPFYFASNTGDAFSSLINIVNTTPDVKVVRVRLHEGAEGASVGSFNVYLDGYDVWTVAVLATADGAGVGTFDKSCTSPPISSDAANPTPLSNSNYVTGPGDVSLARTREGYIEAIEWGDFGPAASASDPISAGVVHVNGIPRNCAVVATDVGAYAKAPTGGLLGSAMLISVAGSVDYYYQATALSAFSDRSSAFGALSQDSPSLADAFPAVSVVRDDAGRTIRSEWTRGIDAVSATLMSESIQGEYVLEPVTQSQTNWVATFPTKWFYVRQGLAPTAPFNNAYDALGACEPIEYPLHSAEPFGLFTRAGDRYNDDFDRYSTFAALCYSAQVLTFNDTTIFPSSHQFQWPDYPTPPTSTMPASIETSSPAGWMSIALRPTQLYDDETNALVQHDLVSGATTIFSADGTTQSLPHLTYSGLPVIGFAASSYYNGTLVNPAGGYLLSTYVAGAALRTRLHVEP